MKIKMKSIPIQEHFQVSSLRSWLFVRRIIASIPIFLLQKLHVTKRTGHMKNFLSFVQPDLTMIKPRIFVINERQLNLTARTSWTTARNPLCQAALIEEQRQRAVVLQHCTGCSLEMASGECRREYTSGNSRTCKVGEKANNKTNS